ncbi:YbjN domain-containing protein [uncultured Corynebacterium sp.]|uniref:YbjN domain-containing protein n=1 Tax=uncultured Corynebacterium sp. TaxID=159447 RepID=UPI0025ECF781|nr:YbjN domain-containing protein [uncultured Corynebacterium sp.]
MFGRKRPRARRQWKDAPDPGTVDVLPDPRPEADLASSVLQRVLVEVGGGNVEGFTVSARATTGPLTFTVDALWHGIAGDGVDASLNRWNAGHTVPRAHAELDEEGRVRVRADSALTCGAGVTVQQLDEWMRRGLAGFTALGEYLVARWPAAEDVEDDDADAEGADDAPAASGDITALVTDGNQYGLLGGRTPAVLLPRLAEAVKRAAKSGDGGESTEVRESGASGRRGNGYLRFASGPDVALHDGTLTVTDGVSLGAVDADTLDWLHALCGRVNALPGGVVAVADGAADGGEGTVLTCAAHRPVGSGLSDAQVSHVMARDRQVVAETLRLLMSEIAGEDADTDSDA